MMNNSDLFATTDPRLRNLMRQYSDYFRQNNLNIQNFNLTQSSHPQMYGFGQNNDLLINGENRRGSDVRSLIQQLMTKKEMKVAAVPSTVNINSARPVLVNTEQRIFQEVVNLLLEINEIKEAIQKEKELTMQMEAQRDILLNKGGKQVKGKKTNDFEMESIINKLKSKEGEELKISVAQLEKISAENQHLEKNINRLKLKSKGNLKQVLEQQKQKYRNLKKKLQQKNSDKIPSDKPIAGTNPELLQEIKRLQADISRLEQAVEGGGSVNYEIRRLGEENQRLKQRTIEMIKQQRQELQQNYEDAEERQRLEQYIREEEQNKLLFYEDLKKFKDQYNALKEENQQLKARLKGSHSGSRVRGNIIP